MTPHCSPAGASNASKSFPLETFGRPQLEIRTMRMSPGLPWTHAVDRGYQGNDDDDDDDEMVTLEASSLPCQCVGQIQNAPFFFVATPDSAFCAWPCWGQLPEDLQGLTGQSEATLGAPDTLGRLGLSDFPRVFRPLCGPSDSARGLSRPPGAHRGSPKGPPD